MNLRLRICPVLKHPRCTRASRQIAMTLEQIATHFDVGGCVDSGSKSRLTVLQRLLREVPLLVEDIRDAAAHAGCKVATGRAEHHNRPVGHVFATMVADSFNNRDAPELRTANRSPAIPFRKTSPLVAP